MVTAQFCDILGDELSVKVRFFCGVEDVVNEVSDQSFLRLNVVHVGQVYIMNLFDDQLALALGEVGGGLRCELLLTQEVLAEAQLHSLI